MGKSPHTLGCVKIHKTKKSKLGIKLRNNRRRSSSTGCTGIFGALAPREERSGNWHCPWVGRTPGFNVTTEWHHNTSMKPLYFPAALWFGVWTWPCPVPIRHTSVLHWRLFLPHLSSQASHFLLFSVQLLTTWTNVYKWKRWSNVHGMRNI